MISKSLSTSWKFATLGDEFAQVLFVLMVSHADDFGRQSGDSFTVKHQVFPTSPRPESDFNDAIIRMAQAGLIRLYSTDGQDVIEIIDFDRHQTGLNKRTTSRFPDSPGNSGNFQEIPSELNLTEGKGTEGNRREFGVGQILSPKAYAKLQETHAYIGSKLRIPSVLHSELMAKSGADADTVLRAWYAELDEQLEMSGEGTGDIFMWLRPRHQVFAIAKGWVKAPVRGMTPTPPTRSQMRDGVAVQQALETRRRRAEMQAQGMSDDDIEAVFEREYDQRKASQ